MMRTENSDAIVVGSGPNGLAAAIRLAQAGMPVTVFEASDTPGGGVRSADLLFPGVTHDICSSVYPMAVCSPFFRTLPLQQYGVEWVNPPLAAAHPLDDGSAAVLETSLPATAASLGDDGEAYIRMVGPLVERWQDLLDDSFAPLHFPEHPFLLARFGLMGLQPAATLARSRLRTVAARALFAGLAAHSMLPLEFIGTSAPALVLAMAAHVASWPFVRGGAQNLTTALVRFLETLGGKVVTGHRVDSLDPFAAARLVLLDVTPRQLLTIAGDRLSHTYRTKLARFRYGMGSFKIDWVLDQPVPWIAEACRRAGTVHVGGTLEEIIASEASSWDGSPTHKPFVLFSQPSLFDPSRTVSGKHIAWGYCHVPSGYSGDVTESIEAQVERFAPGFKRAILARHVMSPADLERHNANLIGGDIGAGAPILSQLFLKPTASLYKTTIPGVFLCSASTPPAAGVHGMCGFFAAETALAWAKSN
jgi:phytoene dehydrogenase-like protein